MTRAQKDVVSYFPHDANAGSSDTLTILQSRYGNNGYAAWFKLLEKIASSEGHYIDCRSPIKWQLLVSYLGLDEITTINMLNLLAEIKAIDNDLWGLRVIWCQNLVNNVTDVYKNRGRGNPKKPLITNGNVITTSENALPTGGKPQSKVKESKVKESKVNNKQFEIPNSIDKGLWNDFLEMRKKMRKPPTDRAKELLIKDLIKAKDTGDNPDLMLVNSIKNSWLGLFPPRNNGGQRKNDRPAEPKRDRSAERRQIGDPEPTDAEVILQCNDFNFGDDEADGGENAE